VLNAEPTLLPKPMSTSTLASMWPIVRAMLPPDKGQRVRFEETVSWEPQGKLPRLSSSKPRAAG
jgi:hypothetical protein